MFSDSLFSGFFLRLRFLCVAKTEKPSCPSMSFAGRLDVFGCCVLLLCGLFKDVGVGKLFASKSW